MAEQHTSGRPGFGEEVRQAASNAAAKADDELQRLIRYLNEEVVPDVRRHGSAALRTAAAGLKDLAEKMDDRRP